MTRNHCVSVNSGWLTQVPSVTPAAVQPLGDQILLVAAAARTVDFTGNPPSPSSTYGTFTAGCAALSVVDPLVPPSPLGPGSQWFAAGWGNFVALSLQLLGWLLSIAVLPAASKTISRQ